MSRWHHLVSGILPLGQTFSLADGSSCAQNVAPSGSSRIKRSISTWNGPVPNPKVLQLMLPAIEKMTASPKAEQGIEKIMQMSRMVEPQGGTNPWRRLIETIQKSTMPEGFRATPRHIESGFPKSLGFEMNKPGTASWSGSVVPTKGNPFELYVEGLSSGGSKRANIGDLEAGLSSYSMDIASPAQRELPLRGMKLSKAEKAQRAPRTREERYGEPEINLPSVPLRDKQNAVDTLLRMARESGFKKMAFSAEPGERPRLYEKLTGYKAKEEGAEDIHSLLGRFTGRGPSGPARSAPGVPEYGSQRTQWAQSLTPQTELSEPMLENALMLSADEALEFGLATRAGGRYRLTPEGVQDVRKALSEMGIDWFAEGAGR